MKTFLVHLAILSVALACQSTSKTEIPEEDEFLLLFVGTYTDKEGHVDGKADGIYALNFNPKTGYLKETSLKANTTNPSYLSVDAQNNMLYAVNEKVGEGEMISSFSYDTSEIQFMNSVKAQGGAPCYIMYDEQKLYTANYVGGNVVVHHVSAKGDIADLAQVINYEGKGVTNRQEAPHAHMITKNPHTGDIVTADLGTDYVRFYSTTEESLREIQALKLTEGSGPRHVDFHPENDWVYVLNELNGTINLLAKEGEEYLLKQKIESTQVGDPLSAGCADIHVHPSGKFLYASNRGSYNTISQYSIGKDGILTFQTEVSTKGDAPRSFTIDPSGHFLLVANQNTSNIVVFKINQKSGALEDIDYEIPAPTPVCLKFESYEWN